MMRTVAEALANIKSLMDRMESREVPLVDGGIYVSNNLAVIHSSIQKTFEIISAENEFRSALNKYTGGRSYLATSFRSSAETEAAKEAAWFTLCSYRDVLQEARPDKAQLIICAVDDTQVTAPF